MVYILLIISIMKNTFLILFYLIFYFGLITMLGKFYEYSKQSALTITMFILIIISLIIISFKKKLVFSTLILAIFFFGANYHFGNFLIDIIFPPTIPALNCTGALPMNGNWIRGFIFSLFTSPIFTYVYYKKLKTITLFEKILALIGLLITVSLVVTPGLFLKMNQSIRQTSEPTVIFPEDC